MSRRRLPNGSWRDSTLTDEQIVGRVIEGDSAMFEIVVRRHQQRIYRTVRAILKNESEVEDVMQQAYLSAYSHLRDFAGASQFSTWLLRIAINEALARVRALGRGDNFDAHPEAEPVIPEHADPERQASAQELLIHAEAAVDELPGIYRIVLVLREIEGLTTAETADCLGVSEEVVKVRLHRARILLRESFAARIQANPKDFFRFAAPRCDRMIEMLYARLTAT